MTIMTALDVEGYIGVGDRGFVLVHSQSRAIVNVISSRGFLLLI